MAEENHKKLLDGFASFPEAHPLDKISKQPPPSDPRIKYLLGKALMEPDTMTSKEVQEMAASVVYHLISEKLTVRE